MDKTTVALVSVVLIMFLVIFGAYTYKVRADQGNWQQPRIETGQPITDVQPTTPPQKIEEPPMGDQNISPQPQKPNRRPIVQPIVEPFQPHPQPIQRPGIIFRRPIMGGGCGRNGQGCGPGGCDGQGCGPNGCQEYIMPGDCY